MTNLTQLPLATSLTNALAYGIQNGNDVAIPGSVLAAGIPNLLPFVGPFSALTPASQFQGYAAITTDLGLFESNGISWLAVGSVGGLPLLPGVYTFVTLPPAVANPNVIAITSDKGPAASTAGVWNLLFNPTNATVQIANNSPLTGAVNGTAYAATITASNAAAPVTWFLQNLVGANVWAIDPNTGIISLTPSHTETSVFMVQVTDATGATSQKIFTIVVAASTLTPAATPQFSPAPGTFGVAKTISITCTTPGASIFYTTNGSTPSTSSTPVTGGVLVNATSTIQAIAIASGFSQSAIGSATYTITTSGAVYKFAGTNGFYMMPPQYGIANSGGIANDFGWIKRFALNPVKGFIQQRQWQDLVQGSTIDNNTAHAIAGTGNYAGFTSEVGNGFNLLQAYAPGAFYGLYWNGIEIWKSPQSTPGCVPNYILNCGGNLTVPNTFGSGSTTAYTLYQYTAPNIVGKCGFLFYAFNSPAATPPVNYGFAMPMYNDPGVMNCLANDIQALSLFTLGASTAYSAGTTYAALGQAVSSGGLFYANISTSNTGNTPASSPTFWKQITNFSSYAGLTLDTCPLVILATGDNTETSAIFNQGPAVAGQTSSANACTYQNWYAGYFGTSAVKKAAFPHTPNCLCESFLTEGSDGTAQPSSTWTAFMATQNALQGTAYAQADISTTAFIAGSMHVQNAAAAYLGLNPAQDYTQPPFSGNLPAFGSFATNYKGVTLCFNQVQPLDFVGGTVTTSTVNKLVATMVQFGATHGFISPQDNNFNTTAWAAVIQPALVAGTQLIGTRPSNLP